MAATTALAETRVTVAAVVRPPTTDHPTRTVVAGPVCRTQCAYGALRSGRSAQAERLNPCSKGAKCAVHGTTHRCPRFVMLMSEPVPSMTAAVVARARLLRWIAVIGLHQRAVCDQGAKRCAGAFQALTARLRIDECFTSRPGPRWSIRRPTVPVNVIIAA